MSTSYVSKAYVEWRLNSLLNYFDSGSIGLRTLDNMLSEFFDGDQAPFISFILSYAPGEDGGEDKFVMEVQANGPDDNVDEWLAIVQNYVGDRFIVELWKSLVPESFSIQMTLDCTASKAALTDAYLTFKDISACFVQKPKAKPTTKPVPPHLAIYEKRGSKGKRKPPGW